MLNSAALAFARARSISRADIAAADYTNPRSGIRHCVFYLHVFFNPGEAPGYLLVSLEYLLYTLEINPDPSSFLCVKINQRWLQARAPLTVDLI
jgi:hypothetical protein